MNSACCLAPTSHLAYPYPQADLWEYSSTKSPLSKKHMATQLANAHLAWVALGMYLLAQVTMLTKAKDTKKAENIHNHQFMPWVSCVALVYPFWDCCDRIVLLNQDVLPAQSSHSSMVDYLQNAHVTTFPAYCSHAGRKQKCCRSCHEAHHWSWQNWSWWRDCLWWYTTSSFFLTYPYHLDCISSPAFLVSAVPNSLFFLASCMWCHNEDRVPSRSGTWCFLSRWL